MTRHISGELGDIDFARQTTLTSDATMRRILLLGITAMLAACGKDQPTGPSPNPSAALGSYQLTAVDGHDLPFTVLDLGTYSAQLVFGTLSLNRDGTYSMAIAYNLDDKVKIRTGADSDAGHWEATADGITLISSESGLVRSGTVSGTLITLESSGRALIFRK